MSLRQMREPKAYTGDRHGYREWRESFHTSLNTFDPGYLEIILYVEKLGRHPFRPEHQTQLAQDLEISREDMIQAKSTLYIPFVDLHHGRAFGG